jgi:hypothetical protein
MLKTFISQSQAKYETVLGELKSFEMKMAESGKKTFDEIHRIKREKHRLPATVQNLEVVAKRLNSFNGMRQKSWEFRVEVDENKYPHTSLYEASGSNTRDPQNTDADDTATAIMRVDPP